ncbi:MAG: YCF48-related protein [candidate division WOR-3 bacterium]
MQRFTIALFCICAIASAQPESWDEVMMAPAVMPMDMCFLADGQHGWFVGSAGAGGEVLTVVMATSDRGETWRKLPFPDSNSVSLGGVFFVSPDRGWVVGSSGYISRTTDAGITWARQTSPVSRKLGRVHFVSEQTGWITGGWNDGGQYLLLKTTNGGTTWQNLSFGSDCYSCEDIWFADSLNGWLVGQNSSINPFIQHTTDGGATWSLQSAPIPSGNGPVSSVCFPTPTTGWAVVSSIYQSPSGTILHTTDGGTTWTAQGSTGLHYNYALDAPDTLHVAILSTQVLGTTAGRLVMSANGGRNWSSYNLPTYSYGYGCQYRGNDIWVAQDNSQVVHSSNSGMSLDWQFYAPMWQSVSWSSARDGWLVAGSSSGPGYCYRTTDGGASWSRDRNAPGGAQVQFVDPNHGWMLREGNSAKVYRTTDGGQSWAEFSVGTSSWVGRMFFASEDSGWACGSQGTMRVTTNGGATWTGQNLNTSNYCEDVFMLNSKTGWAAGGYGSGNGFIRFTTDGGANWQTQNPGGTAHVNRLFFLDAQLGWAGCYGGGVQRTTDGGTTWSVIGSVPHFYLEALVFTDAQTGWLAAGNAGGSQPGEDGRGFIYKTTNGGITWQQEYAAPWPRGWLQDISRQPGGPLWACGNHSGLLKTLPPQAVEGRPTSASDELRLEVWPNLGNGLVQLEFVLPRAGPARLAVYNAAGQLVANLIQGHVSPGRHRVTWASGEAARGVYLCRSEALGQERTVKVCRQ